MLTCVQLVGVRGLFDQVGLAQRPVFADYASDMYLSGPVFRERKAKRILGRQAERLPIVFIGISVTVLQVKKGHR